MRVSTLVARAPSRAFTTLRPLRHENPLGLPPRHFPDAPATGLPPTGSVPRMARGLPVRRALPGVDKIVCVSSAKGGVGKSTVAVNLALSFARAGKRTGLLDADIFGPSVPRLLNLQGMEPRLDSNNRLLPVTNYGVKSMSIGYLVGAEAPVVWRGLMVMKALQQLLHEVEWGGLDVLVLDMPPGTGDTQLTVTQQLVLDGLSTLGFWGLLVGWADGAQARWWFRRRRILR